MVCHESYKDKNGEWLYPEEVEKINIKEAFKKKDRSKVLIGPAESMSKSKKNTVDPESMIKKYGADSVRWFILSDSPPEKDVLWSNTGVYSANKFLQKLWVLAYQISKRKIDEHNTDSNIEDKFTKTITLYIHKIDTAITNFRFNVSIAIFYETYKFL